MPHNRYYVDTGLIEKDFVHLEEEEYHHLVRVLRAKVGEEVELINGNWQLAKARVKEITKKNATLEIQSVLEKKEKGSSYILALGLPRMNHLEWVIEKGTELGAAAFWLFPGLLSEKETVSEGQLARLNHLAISAMKQCGRLDLPAIEVYPPLLAWKPQEGALFFGDTSSNAPYLWECPSPSSDPILFFIGPEKGFAEKEEDFLRNHLKAKGIRLHSNILRAETAPLAALSLLQIFSK